MSGLWDYDDDDIPDDDDDWGVQPQGLMVQDEATPGKKRKGGHGAGRPKKQAVAPQAANLDLQQEERPVAILLQDSDDDDDLVMLPSPVGVARAGASAPAQVVEATPRVTGQPSKTAANLDPETQKSLAREHELLRALQKATEYQPQSLEELDPGPVQTGPRLRPLGLSSMANAGGKPPALALHRGIGAAGISGHSAASAAVADERPSRAAGAAGGHDASSGLADPDDAAAPPAVAETPAQAEDRVVLKLVWASGKDGHVMMRVVKTDPMGKLIEKFRELARQRSLCKDPKKIKFLLDGDDLAKTPLATPEDLDLEDDVIIDVKL